jgi:hypothetical protein
VNDDALPHLQKVDGSVFNLMEADRRKSELYRQVYDSIPDLWLARLSSLIFSTTFTNQLTAQEIPHMARERKACQLFFGGKR